ncbi:DUF4062 domain-containing protein [Hymenobacter sp. 5317J-9]|uniref:DUF4062 domain-containing protein n=1 Tax=Hymenobacter sp. 5317J-9 TaxID=2932250 RepID=UPI001FD6627D|nr:DUF4062 domain-containing protein [Hymenobacter sp. 5317J-9]UOQ99508.1 DUF4062 domain-containing protein [Hymenobacter sp. 5317J-9]
MAKKYQVFISSTFDDLKEHRDAVVKAVLQLGHLPVGMEMFNAGDQTQWETIKSYIDSSDYYLVVLAHRYGSIDPGSGLSYTEQEYDYAGEQGIPRLGFVIDKDAPWPANHVEAKAKKKLDAFKSKVGKARVIKFWDTIDKLAYHISLSLSNETAINPRTGWVRATEAASPQVAEELARLSSKNRELNALLEEIQQTSQGISLQEILRNTIWTSEKDESMRFSLERLFLAVCRAQPSPTTGDVSAILNIEKYEREFFYELVDDGLKELHRLALLNRVEIKPKEDAGMGISFARAFAKKVWNLTIKGSEIYAIIQYGPL